MGWDSNQRVTTTLSYSFVWIQSACFCYFMLHRQVSLLGRQLNSPVALMQNPTRTQRRVSARRPLVRVVDRATGARSHLISLLHLHARSTLPRAHACSSFNDCRTAILIDGTCAQTFTCLEGRCCCCCGDRRRRRRRCRRPNNIINVDKTGECACSFPIVE